MLQHVRHPLTQQRAEAIWAQGKEAMVMVLMLLSAQALGVGSAPHGTWDHWVVWNIPSGTTRIPEGTEPEGVAGKKSWGRTGYGGPCPPKGVHRSRFRLYALDVMLDLAPGSTTREAEAAMNGHMLAEVALVGRDSRE